MKLALKLSLIILLGIGFVAVALYVPTSLPIDSDFPAIYITDLALVHHIPIYDTPKVMGFAAQHLNVPLKSVSLLTFPYPPWYALSTFFLGTLPVKAAATLWFELNLLMLFLSVWFLTDGWTRRIRLIAFPIALMFIPVLGTLSIGQRDFPVLLGTAMLVYSIRKQHIPLTVLGLILLTFKPHIGGLALVTALGWLISHRGVFSRRVLLYAAITVTFLIAIGFLGDPAWPISYPKVLMHYQTQGFIATCADCTNLPVYFSRWLFDGSLASAAWIALGLLLVLVVFVFFLRSRLKTPEVWLSTALLGTLLISPYLYNYDYLILLVPFALLIETGNRLARILVGVCYLVPLVAITLLGRNGNITLLLVTIVLGVLISLQGKEGSQSDISPELV